LHSFNYHKPSTIAEAAAALQSAEDGKFIAGGMTLLPTMKQRLAAPSDLVDLAHISDLQGVRFDSGHVRIGAMTRHAHVARNAEIQTRAPVIAQLAGGIGDVQVRNRGTMGGSIANSDPAADYPAAVLGLGATIETNRRSIRGDDFFLGLFQTALDDNEMIVAVKFPIPDAAAYVKFRQPASRFALVGVMVARFGADVRVAVTGAGACAFRVPAFEQKLAERFSPEVLEGVPVSSEGLNSDIHGDAEYRAHLVGVLARRAAAQILETGRAG
jgi:carbon-monoxide dehydrogenase medium subunit